MKRILTPLLTFIAAAAAPVLYYAGVLLATGRRLPLSEVALLYGTVSIALLALTAVRLRMPSGNEQLSADLADQLQWTGLLMKYSGEIIILLDEFSQILAFSRTLTDILGYTREEALGKPLRDILYNEYFNKLRLNEIILFKLKEVFSGKEAEFVYSCKQKKNGEIITLTFRMIPMFEKGELSNILIIGTPSQIDTFTRNYLVRESADYVLDNNLSQMLIFCHRLTRNLEERIPKNKLIMAQIALQEIFINSIEHGNLEIGYERKTQLKKMNGNYWELLVKECNQRYLSERKIRVSYHLDMEKVTYVIEDEGKGFDWRGYLASEEDVIQNGLLSTYHGFGLQIAKNCFDISFNEKGNRVTLTRYFEQGDTNGARL